MSLRQQAEADLATTLEDGTYGFGWPITLTDPAGGTQDLIGFSNDISQIIDPDTGQAVSGRLASVVLRISSLTGGVLPKAVADTGAKSWLVTFDDINGNPFTFRIAQSNPDRALGIISLLVEFYDAT